jgi:choline transport protein
MTTTFVLSGLLGFLTVLTFAFSLPDIRSLLVESPIPSAETTVFIFYRATASREIASVMSFTLVLLIFGASLSALATAARHIFAFARDEGLPFPSLWRKVARVGGPSLEAGLPFNAFVLALLPTVVAALIQMAYPVTLSCCISLFIASALTGHVIVLACVLGRRLLSRPIPLARWSLGRFSTPINAFALLYAIFALAVSQLPVSIKGLSPATANWSPLVWFLVVLFASVVYAVHGRYVFKAPGIPLGSRSFEQLPSSRATMHATMEETRM